MKAGHLGLAAIALAGATAAAAQPVPQGPASGVAAEDAPNIVLVLVDDGRVDDLTTLPQVDALIGAQGARFVGTTSPFPLCSPARATLLTGQYAHNHRVLGNLAPLGGWTKFADAQTLATWLDPTYDTALIGKYLNEYKAPYVPPGWDYWAVPRALWNYRSTGWSINGADVTIAGYQTRTIGSLAADYITAHAGAGDPYFLYTSVVAPHAGKPAELDDPDMPTPNVEDRYRNAYAGLAVSDPSFNEADVRDKPIRPSLLTSAQIQAETEVNAQRRESLLTVQDVVAQMVAALDAAGELDNTYLWFMSDNGYFLGEHRITSGKFAPYEVAVRVPMMLRGPGVEAGTVVTQPTALVDFAPTVLAMAGVSPESSFPLDGIDVLPLAHGSSAQVERPILIEAGPRSSTATDTDPYTYHGVLATIAGTQWKYVQRATGAKELYDLTHDPHELVNVAGLSTTSAAQSSLARLLTTYQWCAGSGCHPSS